MTVSSHLINKLLIMQTTIIIATFTAIAMAMFYAIEYLKRKFKY